MIVGGNFIGKGAEAMMLTVRDAIEAALPGAVCWVRPVSPAERQRFEEQGFRTIKRCRQGHVHNIIDRVLGSLGVFRQRRVAPETIGEEGLSNVFRVSSVVVDISGFKSSDQFGAGYAYHRWAAYSWARYAGNKLVFMPQAWGPFEKSWVRLFTRLLLRGSELVCARDRLSYEYLVKARCVDAEKVLLFPDITFQFHASSSEVGEQILREAGLTDRSRPIIAMTPNMRIFGRTPGRGIDNVYLSKLTSVVEHFLRETSCQILLIPHEASYQRADDPELCRMVLEQIRERERLFMLTGTESAADIKAVIGLSDFLVASRYHSLIAALSMRIPVAVIGWAHKYDELMREVGLEKWAVDPVRRSGEGLRDVIVEAWEQRDTIRKILQERVPDLEAKSRLALAQMIDVIKSVRAGQ